MIKTPKNMILKIEQQSLEKRLLIFVKGYPKDSITTPLITQLVKAGTSVGANYCEADDAESKKDFRHKIGIVKKEARESKHFLRMIARAVPELKEKVKTLSSEARELNLIFNSIYKKVNQF